VRLIENFKKKFFLPTLDSNSFLVFLGSSIIFKTQLLFQSTNRKEKKETKKTLIQQALALCAAFREESGRMYGR
jgi:hypothetical protein